MSYNHCINYGTEIPSIQMHLVNDFVNELYNLSAPTVERAYSIERTTEMVNQILMANNYSLLDNVFYNLDINKLYIEVAVVLACSTKNIKQHISFRKYFMDRCRKRWKGHSSGDHFHEF